MVVYSCDSLKQIKKGKNMSTTPTAIADSFSIQLAINAPTIFQGNVGSNDIRSTDSSVFGWTAVGAVRPGSFWQFDGNGVLGFVDIVQSGYVTFPVWVTASIITTEMGGRVTLNTDGTLSYMAPVGYVGPDSFSYEIVDGQYEYHQTTVALNIAYTEGGNLRPVAVDDLYTVTAGQIYNSTISVLANDSDGPDTITTDDVLSIQGTTFYSRNGGTVSLYANGQFKYTPPAGFSGVDTFDYVVRDGYIYVGWDASIRATDVGTVTLNVVPAPPPPNVAPVAVDDAFSGGHNSIITGNVLTNDTDANNNALTAVAANITTALGGTVVLNANGTFTYAAATGFAGTDSFSYVVQDGRGGSDTGSVALTLTNAGPTATADVYALNYGQSHSGNVLLNDTDADGDVLVTVRQTMLTAAGGTVVLDHAGNFTYTPTAGHYGNDSFQYTVQDGFGGSAIGLVQFVTAPPGNLISGTSGHDTVNGTSNDDLIKAHDGDDVVYAGNGHDAVYGGIGRDTLRGESGNDKLFGEAGKDTLIGGDGNDTLEGGLNGDTYTGGTGADIFVLGVSSAADYDRITDFKSEDQLAVRGDQFNLALGNLAGAAYDASYLAMAGAADVDHGRFLFIAGSKSLYWDADGQSATANTLLTTFSNKVTIGLSDIDII